MKIKSGNLLSCYAFSEVCNGRNSLEDGLWLICVSQWSFGICDSRVMRSALKLGNFFLPKIIAKFLKLKKFALVRLWPGPVLEKFNFCCKFGQCNSKNDILSTKSTINIEIHVPWWLQCIVHLIFVIFSLKSVNSEKEYNSERILNRFTSTVWNFGG